MLEITDIVSFIKIAFFIKVWFCQYENKLEIGQAINASVVY